LILDSWMYDDWARRIAAGDWMGGGRAFYQDPLYPYFLAGTYLLFGRHLFLVRLVQAALGVATCGLVAAMGRRVGGKLIGHLAAFFLAIYKPAIFQEGEVEKTALGVFLVTAALTLGLRGSLGARLAAGACLGLASLTRGNLVLLVPLGAMFYLTEPGPASAGAERVVEVLPGWRQRLARRLHGPAARSALVFLLGYFVVLAPVAWRNHRVSGEWILTTSQAGAVFYTGNNPANTSGAFVNVPFVRSDPVYEEEDFRSMAESRLGRGLRSSEVSAYWFAEAWRHIAANPGFAAKVTLKKFALFWSNLEVPDAWDMYHLARYSPVLALPLLGMGMLLPLALLGAIAGFRERREVRLLVGFVAAYSLSVSVFFVFSRYRLHVVAALTVLAASAIPWVAGVVHARDLRRGIPAALGAAVVTVFSFWGAADARFQVANQVQSYINLAGLYQRQGDFSSAASLLGEALEKVPGNVTTLCELGRLHLSMGNLRQANEYLGMCVAANPWHPEAWLSLGQVYEANGRPVEAVQAYRKQLEILPGDVKSMRLLAEVELRTGSIGSAVDHLKAIVGRRGEDPRLNLTLAVALLAAGRADDARAVLGRSAARGWPASREDVERERARLFGSAPRP
ncbi:MAG TPA: tetratricopeptide repeat protein, partial [Candidatus Methylomirabilis sp.]|nr:tetratricopeptide repeat protein [Candidatus Methylomirabilis sp.]